MRQLLFAFLLGAVVGGFGSLIAVGPSGSTAVETSYPPTPIVKAPPPPVQRAALPKLDENADDLALASSLDRARFAKDWQRVTEVAGVLRRRAGTGKTASPARLPATDGSGSLILVRYQYRHRAFKLELRGRDNAATQVVARDIEVPEKAQRLRDLLLAPVLEPGDLVVRADAAFLLADLRIEAGRVTLLRTFKDPDAALAEVAAESLCRADDQQAMEALQPILRGDLDPTLRARVAHALRFSRGAVAGGGPAEALAAAAVTDRDLAVRTTALASLAHVDLEACPDALEALVGITENDAEELAVRRACVAALREHREFAKSLPAQLVVALEQALPKTTGLLRLDVIAALGEVGRAESVQVLESARLNTKASDEAQVVRVALEALKKRTQDR